MTNRATRLAILVAMAAFGAVLHAWDAPAQRRPSKPRVDYTRFSHSTVAHRRACDACHVFPSANWKEARAEPFPDVTEFPRHASCLECHRTQFFARERPAPKICSVCHTAVTPKATSRHAFPNPVDRFRSSDRALEFVSAFRVAFPHGKHLEVLGGDSSAAACASCHQTYEPGTGAAGDFVTSPPKGFDEFWLKRGTFKTSPEGHTKCFECHSLDSGLLPAPGECASCHLAADAVKANDYDRATATRMSVVDPFVLKVWRRRDASATFPHDSGLHTEVACTSCHDVAAMDLDKGRANVRVQSCGGEMGCHVTATADEGGALTFEIERRKADAKFMCTKCHVVYSGRPVPPAHSAAVAKVGGI